MFVIFSDLMDLLLPTEMSGYTENISTLIFLIHLLVLSYEPGKVSRTAMTHPNVCHYWKNALLLPAQM